VSTVFNLLVTAHVLCVIGGFGALAYNGLYLSLAQRRPRGGTGAVLEVNRLVSGMAELLVYAAFVFGIGAVTASERTISFSDAWVAAAMGLYVVALGVLHGWIRPKGRLYAQVVERLETPAQVREGAAPGGEVSKEQDVARLKTLEKQVGFGWGAFNLIVVAVVFLMVFQPR